MIKERKPLNLLQAAQLGSVDAMYWTGRFEYSSTYVKYGILADQRDGKQKMSDAAWLGSSIAQRDPVSNYHP